MGLEDFKCFTESIKRCPDVPWNIDPEHLKTIDTTINIKECEKKAKEREVIYKIVQELPGLAAVKVPLDWNVNVPRDWNISSEKERLCEETKRRLDKLAQKTEKKYQDYAEGHLSVSSMIARSKSLYLVLIINRSYSYLTKKSLMSYDLALFHDDATFLDMKEFLDRCDYNFSDLFEGNSMLENLFLEKNEREYRSSAFVKELETIPLDRRSIRELQETGTSMTVLNMKGTVPSPLSCRSAVELRSSTFSCGGNYVAGYSPMHSFADHFPYFPRQELHRGYPLLITL